MYRLEYMFLKTHELRIDHAYPPVVRATQDCFAKLD